MWPLAASVMASISYSPPCRMWSPQYRPFGGFGNAQGHGPTARSSTRALALHGSAAASAPTGWTLTRPQAADLYPLPYYSVKQGINGGGGHDRNRAQTHDFCISSSHSLSGLDASTMPAPAYKVTVSPLTTPDRMATTTVLLVVDKTHGLRIPLP